MEQTAAPSSFAHERNIIHPTSSRDLMLTADDTVKVTDFGTAKFSSSAPSSRPRTSWATPATCHRAGQRAPVDGAAIFFLWCLALTNPHRGKLSRQSITTVITNRQRRTHSAAHAKSFFIRPKDIVCALSPKNRSPLPELRELLEDLRNYRALTPAAGNPDAR